MEREAQSIYAYVLHMGALPPAPHAFGGTGFFRCHSFYNPPQRYAYDG